MNDMRPQAGVSTPSAPRAAAAATGPAASARRVGAIILRHLFLLRSSWTRVVELAYWPTMQMIVWGFITQFFLTHSSWLAEAAGVLITAVLLWDVLFRGQLGVTIPFLEELWSRNLGHLFVSPLRPWEMMLGLTSMSAIRTGIGVLPAALLAIPLYHFNVFTIGLPLLAFFTLLIVMGWALGLMLCGLLMRFGLGAESLVWVAVFAVAPVSGVYYPIATLPDWLQPVALALPSAHVFEGMRAVMFEGIFRLDHFLAAVALDLLYLAIGAGIFLLAFADARRRGSLLQSGE